MSGFSDSISCPNCEEDCNRYNDYKPFDLVNLDCDYCGFYTDTTIKQLDLGELNVRREDADLKPLKALPKWNLDEYGWSK